MTFQQVQGKPLQQVQGKPVTPVLTLPSAAATARPIVFTTAQQHRRSKLIQETGTALRDDPTVTHLRGTMTPTPPRTVWMDFSFIDDLTPYRLTFPNTTPTVSLWMAGRFAPWETLATWTLAEFADGAALWEAVKATLDAPSMDVLHRWLEGELDSGGAP